MLLLTVIFKENSRSDFEIVIESYSYVWLRW